MARKQIEPKTIPDLSLNLKGNLWEVFIVEPSTMCQLLNMDETKINPPCGVTVFEFRRIFLRADLRPQVAKITFFHELSHAVTEDIIATKASKDGKICQELSAELNAYMGAAVLANAKAIETFLKKGFKDRCFTHERLV